MAIFLTRPAPTKSARDRNGEKAALQAHAVARTARRWQLAALGLVPLYAMYLAFTPVFCFWFVCFVRPLGDVEMSRVHQGMTREDVRAAIGRPNDVIPRHTGGESWHYSCGFLGLGVFIVEFDAAEQVTQIRNND
jgi:hypothetical protein